MSMWHVHVYYMNFCIPPPTWSSDLHNPRPLPVCQCSLDAIRDKALVDSRVDDLRGGDSHLRPILRDAT